MKLFYILGFILVSNIVSTLAQDEEETLDEFLSMFLDKSQYVHHVSLTLLLAKLDQSWFGTPIPEPMTFEDFTYNHLWIFRDGISHTFDPKLHGFSTVETSVETNNVTYEATIRMDVPVVHLSGTFDLNVTTYNIWSPPSNHIGFGVYNHTFNKVVLELRLKVDSNMASGRTIATEVESSLNFESCSLWAENMRTGSSVWDNAKWDRQSGIYKHAWDEDDRERDILLSEAIKNYFGVYWGIMQFNKDEAIASLKFFDLDARKNI